MQSVSDGIFFTVVRQVEPATARVKPGSIFTSQNMRTTIKAHVFGPPIIGGPTAKKSLLGVLFPVDTLHFCKDPFRCWRTTTTTTTTTVL